MKSFVFLLKFCALENLAVIIFVNLTLERFNVFVKPLIQVDKERITVNEFIQISHFGFKKSAFLKRFETFSNLSIVVGLFGFHGEFAA